MLLLATLLFSCKKSDSSNTVLDPPPIILPPVYATGFAKGADVSWLTEMETSGKKFYNSTGTQMEGMALLKSIGMNAIRLRVWVNPTNGYNNTADVVAKATRAKNLGLRLLLDFHYSDSWADPGQQTKPAAWAGQNIASLQTSVYDHTFNVLTSLKNAGVVPEWVQVGNETNNGMPFLQAKAFHCWFHYLLEPILVQLLHFLKK